MSRAALSAALAASLCGAPPAAAREGGRLALVEGWARVEHGFVKIPGEVTNGSAGWIRSLRIEVELFDAAGRSIHKDRVYASRYRVPPGEVTPFQYVRDTAKLAGQYASHSLQVSALEAPDDQDARIEELAIVRAGRATRVTGRLRSHGRAPCEAPAAVAAGYDTQGRLLEVRKIVPEAPRAGLPPGASVGFKLTLGDPDGTHVAEVKAWSSCGR